MFIYNYYVILIMVNNMYEDNNDGVVGSGSKSRFNDRLNKIRKDKFLKKKNIDDESKVITGSRNILKIVLAIPSVVYSNIRNHNKNNKITDLKKKDNIVNNVSNNSNIESNNDIVLKDKKLKVKQINDINVSLLKKKKQLYLKKYNSLMADANNREKIENDINILQKEIISLIKKKLVKNLNEFEILQSELYVLRELDSEDVYYKVCQEDIKEIKKLLSKIKALKEKYDYLKDNVDFEYMLSFDDNLLIDKILELKELCSQEDIKYVIDNYKILDEYKYLYLKIDKLQDDTVKLENYKNQKAIELRERDIDFNKFKDKVYDVDIYKEQYERFISEQERLVRNIDEKLLNIATHQEVTYRLKGFNVLLGNSFKYLGLLLLNPLKGLFPSIAVQTVFTRNTIHNLYNNLEWEKKEKTVYDTIDCSVSIDMAIKDIDKTASLVDLTLKEVIELKSKYMDKFKEYENDVYGYKEAIKKINKIENAVLNSKIKIDLIKQMMLEKEKQNKNNLQMVKKLNSSNNN